MKCVYEKKAFEQQSPAVQFVMLYLRGGDFSPCSFTLKLCRSLVAPALASDFRIVKLERSTRRLYLALKRSLPIVLHFFFGQWTFVHV